ncbi:hypothetical protein IC582_007516 [Cucumis melo]
MPLYEKMDYNCERVLLIYNQTMLISTYIFKVHKRMDLITEYYYLCNAGYPNAEGFLDLYRGQQYHLQERRSAGNATTNAKEYFNMKHSLARNVIERAFGVLKDHWVVLRGKSYYLLQVQCRTILACCLVHNLINRKPHIATTLTTWMRGTPCMRRPPL